MEYSLIAALAVSGDLMDTERDTLVQRLMANWKSLDSPDFASTRFKNAL